MTDFSVSVFNPHRIIADVTLLREGLKLARKIGQTPPLSSAMGKEILPGSQVNTDAEWDAYLKNNVGTEYHPSCTCAMLPKSQGGVVDANLRVYGLGKFPSPAILLPEFANRNQRFSQLMFEWPILLSTPLNLQLTYVLRGFPLSYG
jgi:choline dehydrogenase-like flavoprotein